MLQTGERPLPATFDMLLAPIAGENPCGISLKYEPIYDKVREARREDDQTVSRGIWQYELKRADWSEVEKIACDILSNQSKDLQVAGWLGEAWTVMDGIVGTSRSVELIKGLCERFWPNLYPEIDNGDTEFRIQFFDWYDRALLQRFVELPIIDESYGDQNITLADWMSAVQFEKVLKRSSDSARLLQKAEAKGKLTLKKINALLQRIPSPVLQEKIDNLQILNGHFIALTKTLDQLLVDSTMGFRSLKTAIDDMIRIYKSEYDQRQGKEDDHKTMPQPQPTQEIVTEQLLPVPSGNEKEASISQDQGLTREKVYQQLAEIADFLAKTEPHSPASQLLDHIVQWENKTLLDILNDMGSTPEEMVALMRFLGGAPHPHTDKP